MKKCISLCVVLLVLCVFSDNCMEIAKKSGKKAKECAERAAQWIGYKIGRYDGLMVNRGLIQNKEALTFDIMFMNYLPSFGHSEICAFAVNKQYHAILCQSALQREMWLMDYGKKERAGKLLTDVPIDPYLSLESSSSSADEDVRGYWNNDRSVCAQIMTDKLTNELKLHYWFLVDGKAKYACSFPSKLSHSLVEGLPEMRFCLNGDICTYRWTDQQKDSTWGEKTQLIEYRLSQIEVSDERRCCLYIEAGFLLSLFHFKSLPFLLRAFLNSSVRHEGTTMKIYNLHDAHIPVDYSNKKLTFKEPLNGLSQLVQDAIIRRCAIQYKKLKKK